MWVKIRSSEANSVAASQFIPMLLDGNYDTSCSREIGVKDVALTIALGEGVGLEREAIEKMIVWSVGANRVLEHATGFMPMVKNDLDVMS